MDKKVTPDQLMCGDSVKINGREYTLKGMHGPDQHGTYDLYVRDQYGQDRIEIVAEAITLHL